MKIVCLIKPNSKHKEEIKAEDDHYVISVKSPAIEGRANQAAIKLIADYFETSPSRIRLVSGHRSRHKIFEIDN